MWYKVTWSYEWTREEKFTELIFSYEDKLTQALATKMNTQPARMVIHEIQKYALAEGSS